MSSPQSDLVSVIRSIARELNIPERKVQSAVDLLTSGNTIPFIARYRKEATGGIDEIDLRSIEDSLDRFNALAARKTTILKSISEQGLMTPDLKTAIEACVDIGTLESIYLPFKPKRRTRAAIGREKGLQPLADLLIRQEQLKASKNAILKSYVDPAKDVLDTAAALQGALDIVAEHWSEDVETRNWLVRQASKYGKISSKVKRGKRAEAEKFDLYLDHQELVSKAPSHRVLAMMRGQDEGVLRVGIQLDESRELADLKRKLVHNRQFGFYHELLGCVEDCYSRLLLPATESSVLQKLKESADEQAIKVFGINLTKLLMAAPAGPRVTIGIDPGFRTGCKVAVVDETGKFVANKTIFPTPPKKDVEAAGKTLLDLIQEHNVELVAIGNGTASRETDAFVGDLIKQNSLKITKVIVSESGASIYSASELASKEFPDLDITVRGAISIARRLQDPLAELVKSDPKSIGVGQYQHDVNQAKLRKCLDRVVESCVNSVGVDLNTASVPLLSYVAGIGPRLAENIVDFRDSRGRFSNRAQLIEVAKLGKRAFEQAAGFLRIQNGDQPLDNSAVHPESYSVVKKMASHLNVDSDTLVGNAGLSQKLNPESFVDERFGLPTVTDIIAELGKPGRDPRSVFQAVAFNASVNKIEDLQSNMVLEGVITNVTHFGAFVDLGVHQDALIHISQLSNEFVKDPNEVVAVGDIVKVKVVEIDVSRKRISATRKF